MPASCRLHSAARRLARTGFLAPAGPHGPAEDPAVFDTHRTIGEDLSDYIRNLPADATDHLLGWLAAEVRLRPTGVVSRLIREHRAATTPSNHPLLPHP